MRLTDAYLRRMPRPPRRIELRDSIVTGLVLRAGPSGAKTWGVRYRARGRAAVLTLGPYRTEGSGADGLTLAEARARARATMNEVRSGGDPQAAKIEARNAPTVAEMAEAFLADGRSVRSHRRAWRESTRAERERLIRREIVPAIGRKRPEDVTKADLRNLSEAIAKRAPILANRVLAVCHTLFRWAVQTDRLGALPAFPQRPRSESTRDRVLSEDELRRVWGAMADEPGIVGRAFALLLLTAQRKSEVLRMRWADLTQEGHVWWWTIPADVAKNGRAHRVPLVAAVLDVLDGLRVLAGDSPWVFPSAEAERPIRYVQKAADRLWSRSRVEAATLHDLRRTAATLMARSGVSRFVVGRVLNHTETGVTAIYDRHEYDSEKRTALETWARTLHAIATGAHRTADVVPLVRA